MDNDFNPIPMPIPDRRGSSGDFWLVFVVLVFFLAFLAAVFYGVGQERDRDCSVSQQIINGHKEAA